MQLENNCKANNGTIYIGYAINVVIMCNSTASCLCNDTSNNAVQTVCSGPSTAPCICSAESCKVSVQSVAYNYHTTNYSVTHPLTLVMVVFVD